MDAVSCRLPLTVLSPDRHHTKWKQCIPRQHLVQSLSLQYKSVYNHKSCPKHLQAIPSHCPGEDSNNCGNRWQERELTHWWTTSVSTCLLSTTFPVSHRQWIHCPSFCKIKFIGSSWTFKRLSEFPVAERQTRWCRAGSACWESQRDWSLLWSVLRTRHSATNLHIGVRALLWKHLCKSDCRHATKDCEKLGAKS